MADDEKAANPEISSAIHPSAGTPSEERPPETARPLEWTASDARGPLVTAVEGADLPGADDAAPKVVSDAEGTPRADASPAVTEPVVPEPVLRESPAQEPAAEHPVGASESAPAVGSVAAPAADDAKAAEERHGDPPRDEPKKRSLLPMAAALVVGAVIGAGSAALVYTSYGPSGIGSRPDMSRLSSRVDALERRPDAQTSVAALQGTVADLGARIATLEKGTSPKASASQSGAPVAPLPPQSAVDLTPLQKKVAELQASIDALKARGDTSKALDAKIAALESEVAGVKKDSATAQAGLATAVGQQKVLVDKVMVPALAVVADSLVQQIDQGQPYGGQVDALTALGADPVKIAILRQNADKGVPSAKVLAAKFEPLAEPITETAHKAPPNAGFVDRLKSGMFSMVSIRSADDTSGTDLPSRVALIKANLAHDDIAGALAAWNALPVEAKAKSDAWGALAKTSAEAMDAARALQHDAIAALGAKKS